MKYLIIPLLTLAFFSNTVQAEKNYRSTDSLFGVDLQWYEQRKSRGFIKKFLTKNRVKLQSTLDPDCLYKKAGNTLCGKKVDKKLLAQVEADALTFKKETNGLFDPNRKNKEIFPVCRKVLSSTSSLPVEKKVGPLIFQETFMCQIQSN